MICDSLIKQALSLQRQGASDEEISKELELDLSVVKGVLVRNGIDRDINDEQLGDLRRRAYHLAMFSEHDAVSARMVEFLIERDKPRQKEQPLQSSITLIQNAIISAQQKSQNVLTEYGL